MTSRRSFFSWLGAIAALPFLPFKAKAEIPLYAHTGRKIGTIKNPGSFYRGSESWWLEHPYNNGNKVRREVAIHCQKFLGVGRAMDRAIFCAANGIPFLLRMKKGVGPELVPDSIIGTLVSPLPQLPAYVQSDDAMPWLDVPPDEVEKIIQREIIMPTVHGRFPNLPLDWHPTFRVNRNLLGFTSQLADEKSAHDAIDSIREKTPELVTIQYTYRLVDTYF